MDPKELMALFRKELAEALTPITTFLADESARRSADADAAAETLTVEQTVEAFDVRRKAIEEASLVEDLAAPLLAAAKRGEDIADALESAKKTQAAVEAALKPKASDGIPSVAIIPESSGAGSGDEDWTFGGSR
jgi:hypothetical protein